MCERCVWESGRVCVWGRVGECVFGGECVCVGECVCGRVCVCVREWESVCESMCGGECV